MTKELVIAHNRHETKVAVLEDDQLVEIYFQRAQEYSLAGSVHKGKVTRVLPGMQSAFVDLGLERDTFLYVSDFFEESDEYEKLPVADERPPRRERDQDRDRDRGPREQREPRELREAREPKPIEEAAEPAALEPPAEVTAEATESAPVAAVARPDGRPERGDRGDRGDRERGGRGRRGRRRRGRGGRDDRPPRESRDRIPESKYAEPSAVEEEAAEEPMDAVESMEDFAVLPGESLAKYSRVSDDDAEPVEDELEEEAPATSLDEEPEAVASQAFTEPEVEPEPVAEAVTEEEEEEVPAVTVVASEPLGVDEVATVSAVEEEATGLTEEQLDEIQKQAEAIASGDAEVDEDEDEPAAEVSSVSVVEEVAEELAAAAAEEPAVDAVEDAAMAVEGSADAEGEDEEPADSEGAEEVAAAPAADAGPDAENEPALASMGSVGSSHREQTQRFLRGRRMRRRRGDKQDAGVRTVNREERPPQGERAAAPERPSRPERAERPERTERTDRPERAERAERTERPERSERSERPERGAMDRAGSDRPPRDRAPQASITDLLSEGQEIVVQIAKEPMGQKGARITSHIALPGRFCVYMPTIDHMGVSRKIASDDERLRLRRILQTHRQGLPGGFIIRTAGEGKSEEAIAQDIQYLFQLWQEIKAKAEKLKAPALLYHDVEIVQRLLRDQLTDNFKAIWVDNEELYESVLRFVQRMAPHLVSRVKLYTRSIPVFDAFNITAELEKALRPKVWLKSGGYIVINQTEALVAVDVNTGKFVGKSNRLEDTIVKTNTDAVKEIVRQIRLRDLGGIIVVDFIDMDERKNRQKVMQALEEAMRADRAPNKILQFNDFGLVAITRKRVKQSLERTLCSPCPTCEGSGYTKSVQTVISEILMEAGKLAPHIEGKELMLRVHPTVAVTLKSKDNDYLEELEEIFGRPVLVTGDDSIHPEKFDLA
ncbi:MAG: Rne/Rng family ribonuclease [Acidobacteria bacterium]|nr:Rne/Rng family ribonuclease [Acidobacteriota bacterium]